MALFSRRKDIPGNATAESHPAEAPPTETVAETRPGRRRTVGQLLRETREGFGSDIPRVAAALRIRAAYLEAIEEGQYDRLPGPVYALGFVRAYAVHLGLDGEEAVRRFKLEAEGFEAQRDLSFPVPLAERSMPGGAMVLAALILAVCAYGIWYYVSSSNQPRPERVSPVPAELAKRVPPAKPPAAPSSVATVPAPAATAAAAPPAAPTAASPPPLPPAQTAAVAPAPATPPAASPAGSPAVPAAASAAPPPVPAPASASRAAPPSPAVAAAPADAPVPSAPPAAVPPAPQAAALPNVPAAGAAPAATEGHVYGLANGSTRILIRALKDSWIQIRDKDGKSIFTRELHPGDLYHVPDEPGLSMKTGNGSGLAVTVDGQQTPPIGGAVHDNVVLDPARLLAGSAVE
jgi:cytoskeleton protein RodZ